MFLGKRERQTKDRQTRGECPDRWHPSLGFRGRLDPPALILDTTRPKGNARTGIRAVPHHHSSWTKELRERFCKNSPAPTFRDNGFTLNRRTTPPLSQNSLSPGPREVLD
jgi:hypothetical protein